MCHIERTIADPAVLLELAATGVYLEYDLFGLETSYYPYNPAFDMPNDGERMRQILFLIEHGHLPASSCPTTSPTSTASRGGAGSATTISWSA